MQYSHGPLTIPPCPWCPYSGRQHHPMWWGSCHPPFGKGQGATIHPWRPPRNIQMPIQCPPMHLLAWHQLRHQMCCWSMCYMPVQSPTGTVTATQANPSPWTPMAIPCSWLHALWWQPVSHHHQLLLKMPFICKIPPSQCNAAKMISTLKELFTEHGIPELLCSDNGPKFASALFTEFATNWNFDHCTSAPTNPHSNGQAEAAVKIVNGLLTQSRYSGQDPYLTLLAYHSTPLDAHMHSPGEMLYQHALCTTVPQHICHTDPHTAADHDHLDWQASLGAANHDHQGCQQKALLFAGHSASVLNDSRCLWLPSTIICAADHGPYIVQVISSGQYWCACNHINEHHPDAVKPDKHVTKTVAHATPTHLSPRQCNQHQVLHLQHLSQLQLHSHPQYPKHCGRHPLCTCFPMHSHLHWSWPAQHLLPLAILLGAVSHHPSLLKRCRPRSTLDDGPDDALTWTTPGIW